LCAVGAFPTAAGSPRRARTEMRRPVILDPRDPDAPFPPAEAALREPDGLLAVGGDLHPRRLLRAYRAGIFPWYGEGQPILWWSPDPRLVLFPRELHVSRSLRKTLRRRPFEITLDTAFEEVITACAQPRRGESGTGAGPSALCRPLRTACRASHATQHLRPALPPAFRSLLLGHRPSGPRHFPRRGGAPTGSLREARAGSPPWWEWIRRAAAPRASWHVVSGRGTGEWRVAGPG